MLLTSDDAWFRDEMFALVPNLRAFAIALTNDLPDADDLVQETLLRAWAHRERFEQGTNMGARLFTILRKLFHSEYRRRRREIEDWNGAFAASLSSPPDQQAHLEYEELRAALATLPLIGVRRSC